MLDELIRSSSRITTTHQDENTVSVNVHLYSNRETTSQSRTKHLSLWESMMVLSRPMNMHSSLKSAQGKRKRASGSVPFPGACLHRAFPTRSMSSKYSSRLSGNGIGEKGMQWRKQYYAEQQLKSSVPVSRVLPYFRLVWR